MNKKLGWFLPFLLAILGILAFVMPVLAAHPQPNELKIEQVYAFQNAKVENDQLYLLTYYISMNSTTDADDLFIFRLFDEDDNELAVARPYPFHEGGYGYGTIAFYLDPDEAPTWESEVTIQVSGNPLADWVGDPPSTSTQVIVWNTGSVQNMQEAISGKILSMAAGLELAWDVELTTVLQGATFLSATGAAYFLKVVPYLSTVAPYVLGQYIFTPDYPIDEKPATDDYAEALEAGIHGTIFDLSGTARSWGMSRGALTAGIYYAAVIAFFVMLIARKGLKKGMMLLLWPFVIAGAFFGIRLEVTILGGFICLISTVWVFYKGTT